MRLEHGSYNFSCQFELNPVPPEDQVFKPEWVQKWVEIPYDGLKVVICVDPASTTKKTSDFTSMVVIGWDINKRIWILDVFRDRMTEFQRGKKVFALHRRWQKKAQNRIPVLYETVSFQVLDKSNLQRMMSEENYYFHIEDMKGGEMHKAKKEDRIRALQPFFERGEILLPPGKCIHHSYKLKRDVDMMNDFFLEYNMFPRSIHDDILDACSFPLYWSRFRGIRAWGRKEEEVVPENRLKNWLDLARKMDELKNIPANKSFSDYQLQQYVANKL